MAKDNISFVQFLAICIAMRDCNLCRIIINHEWSNTAIQFRLSSCCDMIGEINTIINS